MLRLRKFLGSVAITGLMLVPAISLAQTDSIYQSATDTFSTSSFDGNCTINGEVVPCDQVWGQMKGVLGWGIGFMIAFIIISILAGIFWIWMLVHAATKPIENRAVWIVVMVLTGIIGSIVYYFAVKRPFDATMNGRAEPMKKTK